MFRKFAANAPYYAIGVLVALGLKAGYSVADSDGLRWILAPTAWLTTLATRIEFDYVAGEGYLNAGHDILIAPACAGVNFLIISFCMLTFTHVQRAQTPLAKLALLLTLGLVSYAVTVLVNATRIVFSIHQFDSASFHEWLSSESIHRIEGVAIYFLALSLLYCASETVAHRVNAGKSPKAHTEIRKLGKRFTLLAPLFWYLLITLGVPLLRTPTRLDAQDFIEHGLVVLIIPVLVVVTCLAITFLYDHGGTGITGKRKPAKSGTPAIAPPPRVIVCTPSGVRGLSKNLCQ